MTAEQRSMFFSVIIPTCHRNDDLARCLDRLAPGRQDAAHVVTGERNVSIAPVTSAVAEVGYEVVVSDDGSESTAESMLRQRHPWARWIPGPRRGPAANRNRGASQATGSWLIFLDDDCLPEAGLIRAYATVARRGNRPVLEGRISPNGRRTRLDMECPVNETGGYLWSCNFAIRRDLFSAVDGFDPAFPGAAMEDVELRTRLKKRAVEMEFVPSAGVLHPWRQRKGGRHIRLHASSVAYFVAKHPEMRPRFAPGPVAYGTLRRILLEIPRAIGPCRARGLVRELWLSIYAAIVVTAAVRRAKSKATMSSGEPTRAEPDPVRSPS
jgi:GT2 family glycosyltransferase